MSFCNVQYETYIVNDIMQMLGLEICIKIFFHLVTFLVSFHACWYHFAVTVLLVYLIDLLELT